ncbi:MAG: hypothetical protein RLZZ511_963 [Cyanobacteriota bacterium]|jgi:hypothetical protein
MVIAWVEIHSQWDEVFDSVLLVVGWGWEGCAVGDRENAVGAVGFRVASPQPTLNGGCRGIVTEMVTPHMY